MGRNDFNRKQCIRSLLKLSFVESNKRRGNHDKFTAPDNIIKNKRPNFIMVPRSRKLHCQLEILKEIRAFGGDSLVEEFLDNL